MIALEKHRTDWELKRIKYLATYNDESLPDNTDPEYEIEYIEIGDVDHVNGITHSQELEFEKAPSRARRIVRTGDTLVSTVRTYLKAIAYVDEKFDGSIASTGFAVIRSIDEKKIDPKFLGYCFQDKRLIGEIVSNSQGVSYPAINPSTLVRLSIRQPHYTEQTLIARFLDQKTSQIDRLIEQKESLLKLLAEKRTAIITQAVTKGLDSDVQMKDSGIDWLGEIPKHWIPKRLKYLTNKIIDGTHSTPEYLSEGIPFLRVTDIVKSKGEKLDSNNFKYISEEEHQELIRRCNPEKGDLLYSKNGTIGIPRIIDWDFEFSVFVSLCLVKIKRDLLIPSFLSYSLQSKLTENQISIGSKKSAVINLHLDKIKEFVIPYPPMDEQIIINNWLNDQLPKFNKSEKKLVESIGKLKEYREALITSAVTGQIDVRKEVVDE